MKKMPYIGDPPLLFSPDRNIMIEVRTPDIVAEGTHDAKILMIPVDQAFAAVIIINDTRRRKMKRKHGAL